MIRNSEIGVKFALLSVTANHMKIFKSLANRTKVSTLLNSLQQPYHLSGALWALRVKNRWCIAVYGDTLFNMFSFVFNNKMDDVCEVYELKAQLKPWKTFLVL